MRLGLSPVANISLIINEKLDGWECLNNLDNERIKCLCCVSRHPGGTNAGVGLPEMAGFRLG